MLGSRTLYGNSCSKVDNALAQPLIGGVGSGTRFCRTKATKKCQAGNFGPQARHSDRPILVADSKFLGPTHNLLAPYLHS